MSRRARRTLTWAFVVRSGSERDLIDELGEEHLPESIAEGIVVSASRPKTPENTFANLAFARQAMRLSGPPAPLHPEQIADRLAAAFADRRPRSLAGVPWTLQIVSPDSTDPHDPRRRALDAIEAPLFEALTSRLDEATRKKRAERPDDADLLIQVWALDEAQAVLGVTSAQDALSRLPGGKIRLRRAEDAPSRSGLKLEEAIAWAGIGPEKGELCVDLGAAPGGWSQVAVGRGAHVIAVDPGRVQIDLPPKRFRSVNASAFDFVPEETVDWVLCDMAWRPLEVAQLIAKWGRRVWARQLIANFKLPMKRKAEILRKVLGILEQGGWRGLRARQLYYDRDEVTVFGWLDPNLARKGMQAPFELRSRRNKDPRGAGGGPRRPRPRDSRRGHGDRRGGRRRSR
jgi:23S rRNA (cytidine2498-2'-O)-methyltransferase